MKVKIIKWKNLEKFLEKDELRKKAFNNFYQRINLSDWENPQEILNTFSKADLVTCEKGYSKIVFNISRNRFRLICGYSFRSNSVNLYIKFVGTHKEYDLIDVCKVNMFKK